MNTILLKDYLYVNKKINWSLVEIELLKTFTKESKIIKPLIKFCKDNKELIIDELTVEHFHHMRFNKKLKSLEGDRNYQEKHQSMVDYIDYKIESCL